MADNVLNMALLLHELGYAAHWCRPRSKAPLAFGWATAPVASPDELREAYQPGFNLGVRAGLWSKPVPGSGLLILDLDIRQDDDDTKCEAYETLYRFCDFEGPEVLSGSGVGRHLWFRCSLDRLPSKANSVITKSSRLVAYGKSTVPAWTLELLGTGKNVICPPSTHPSGGMYQWFKSPDSDLPLVPRSMLEAVAEDPIPHPSPLQPKRGVAKSKPYRPPYVDDSIADRFNAAVSWSSILEPAGWQYVRGGEWQHWTQPGKNPRDGISASTRGDVFFPFTTSTEFEAGKGYSKFAVFSILEYAGDMQAAARSLGKLVRGRKR